MMTMPAPLVETQAIRIVWVCMRGKGRRKAGENSDQEHRRAPVSEFATPCAPGLAHAGVG